jgi:hypothetical protein
MSTGANTSVRGHIDAKLRNADRKGGNQTDQIENMTETEPVSHQIRHFPDDFFNNIGQERALDLTKSSP